MKACLASAASRLAVLSSSLLKACMRGAPAERRWGAWIGARILKADDVHAIRATSAMSLAMVCAVLRYQRKGSARRACASVALLSTAAARVIISQELMNSHAS
eukprot:7077195-Prymnesium_polylepis.1